MTAAVATQRFPEIVWDSPMLRSIDARARAEIEAAGRLGSFRAGDVVFRPGDPADALYVVVSGAVALAGIRRGEADAVVIRRAAKGDVFGEEATVAAFSARQLEARCEAPSQIAELPLTVLRRAAGRAGGAEHMARVERALRRAATLDLLRTASFTRMLEARDLEILLDAARQVDVARGELVYREGDEAAEAFLVADGMLQAQTDDEGKPRVEAYLSRGDLFGDEEVLQRESRAVSVVACGPARLVAIARDVFVVVARRNGGRLDGERRVRTEIAIAERPRLPLLQGTHTTAHAFKDVYRMRIARSLLVINQDSCIRCGHCAWSCANVHEDGISRLVRRGDKILVDSGVERASPLLVPNSCQHCKNPSCMIDCPTGAIGRDARGEVFIREDLCTGCGNCAKGCPWENIQMAPRAERAPATKGRGGSGAGGSAAPAAPRYPEVAVKCDLCKGVDGGPACVASCPTQAIARIDPNAELAPLGAPGKAKNAALAAAVPASIPAWPWALGAALAGVGLAASSLGPWSSGILVGVLLVVLVAYAGLKRAKGFVMRLRARHSLSRPLYVAHLALGSLAAGAMIAHTGLHVPASVAGALVVALTLAVASGALGAVLAAVVPRALSRIERKSVLPEELGPRARELDEKLYGLLSGKSELVKTLFAKVLRPYRQARLGALALVLSGRSLRQEEERLRARVDRLLQGRAKDRANDRLVGMDDLVRLVVEQRATRAQRGLTWALRGFLFPHLAATAAALVLVVLHLVSVLGGPR
jgi:Fe-S-cluster-containing dehydrogenase component/CRP-like cAMP-binding protein